MSWFSKLKQGLSKTAALFSFTKADEAALEEMEEALIRADMGYRVVEDIMTVVRREKPTDGQQLRQIIRQMFIPKMEHSNERRNFHAPA